MKLHLPHFTCFDPYRRPQRWSGDPALSIKSKKTLLTILRCLPETGVIERYEEEMHTLGMICGALLVVFIVMVIKKRKR
jgi:hypothetical protein